jgi:hypothetical protein
LNWTTCIFLIRPVRRFEAGGVQGVAGVPRNSPVLKWRMGRDSNPRYLAVHTLSRRAQSTALAPIRNEPTSLVSIARSCNPFVTLGTPGIWQNRFLDQDQKPCLAQTGGEPHWNCSASRSGKGLSRESLKDLFAAAPCWCGTSDDSFNPSALKTCLHPGRRVYPNARSATILQRRHASELQRGMQRPSGVTSHFSLAESLGKVARRSPLARSRAQPDSRSAYPVSIDNDEAGLRHG